MTTLTLRDLGFIGGLVTAPTDPNFSSVGLLLHGDGANNSTTFTDSGPAARTITVYGDAKISTAQSKFGGASMLFDGFNDYVTPPSSTDFQFGTGDFTIEGWAYFTNTSSGKGVFQQCAAFPNNSTSNSVALQAQDGKWAIYAKGAQYVSTTSISTNTWYFFSVRRSGTTTTLHIDNTLIITVSGDSTNYSNQLMVVGNIYSGEYGIAGNIDDFRVTKGVVRSVTPPTAAFPDA